MKIIALSMLIFLSTHVFAENIIKEETHNMSLGGGEIECVGIFSLWGSRSRMVIVPHKPTIGAPVNSDTFYSKKMSTDECNATLKEIVEQNRDHFYFGPEKYSLNEVKDIKATKIISLFSQVNVSDCHGGIRETIKFSLWGVNFTGISDFEIFFQPDVGFEAEDICAKNLDGLKLTIN